MIRRAAFGVMRVLLLLMLVFVCGGGDPSPAVEPKFLSPDETQQFLLRIRENLGSLRTLRADFLQQRRMEAFMDTLTAKGTCYFQAPDKLRWELKEPYHSALVYNQGEVGKFLYEDGRARRLNPPGREIMTEVLKFITGWMWGDFESTKKFFDLQIEEGDALLIRLLPRSTKLKDVVRSIELSVRDDPWQVNGVTIREMRGDEIVITFSRQERNVKLDEALFALQ